MADIEKTLKVIQPVKELLYDIRNETYLAGLVHEAEGKGYQAPSNMQVGDDENDGYQIRNSLSHAFSYLKNRLGEYLQNDNASHSLLDGVAADGDLVIELVLPNNHNDASTDAIISGIHEYLVNAAIAKWYTITNREEAQTYIQRASASMKEISKALYKRNRPQRP